MPSLQMPARSSGHVALSPFGRTAWKSDGGKYLGEAFLSGGRICLRRKKKKNVWVSGLLGGRLYGEQLYLQRNAQHLMGRGSPEGSAPNAVLGLPGGEQGLPRPRRLQRSTGRAATPRAWTGPGPGAGSCGAPRRQVAMYAGLPRCGSGSGVGRAEQSRAVREGVYERGACVCVCGWLEGVC